MPSITPETFRQIGHELIDDLADFLTRLENLPVNANSTAPAIREALGTDLLPEEGKDPATLVRSVSRVLQAHSCFNSHPGFMGYITAGPLPIGILGDLLAAAINPNVGAWQLSPVATEMERQVIRWIAQFIGYPEDAGGILVSGGNMANYVGIWAARRAMGPADIQQKGLKAGPRQLVAYVSQECHTWIQKTADLFGIGTDHVRWVAVDEERRMDVQSLRAHITADRKAGYQPFLVVGTGGSVSLGVVDPLEALAEVCQTEQLWLHVDGAYGAPAAGLPSASSDLKAVRLADSVALDPHKWFYSPLEAACCLVKNPKHLTDAFSYRPAYYSFEQGEINLVDFGPQNSRGFRALKVWLSFQSLGRLGFIELMEKDIELARYLYERVVQEPELHPFKTALSITTFSFVPHGGDPTDLAFLNALNKGIMEDLQAGGAVFLSNAVVDGRYLLRACLVNFRTQKRHIDQLVELVVERGRARAGARPSVDHS